MTSTGRAATVLVVAMLIAGGIAAFVYVRDREEEAVRSDATAAADASVDAHAKAAKAKAAPKKKAARGGKTHVTARGGGGGAAHAAGGAHGGGGAHGSAPHSSGATPAGHDAPRAAHKHHAAPSGPTYESALDSNNQHVTMGGNAGPDLTDAQLSAPMSDGTFVSECGAPDDMSVTVKVAIKMGRAVGVSVSTNPPSSDVAGCIDHHVRKMTWPVSRKMDSVVTTY